MEKDFIIHCERGRECKSKGFALDYKGYGHGKIKDYLSAWREWHEEQCGGKLIQAVIVKEDFVSSIQERIKSTKGNLYSGDYINGFNDAINAVLTQLEEVK